MIAKYAPHFASLSQPEAAYTAAAVLRRTGIDIGVDVADGSKMFESCSYHGIGQADVVMSMARDPSPMAVVCLEKLVGKPLRKPENKPVRTAKQPASARPKGAAVRRNDPRRIVSVAPNPKKAGSASHARYELYREGMTIDEFLAAGGSTADIRHDTAKGFIKIEEK